MDFMEISVRMFNSLNGSLYPAKSRHKGWPLCWKKNRDHLISIIFKGENHEQKRKPVSSGDQ